MSYPVIASQRMPYDIDGTEVGYNMVDGDTFIGGVKNWLDSATKGEINDEDFTTVWENGFYGPNMAVWFFFPEAREITHICVIASHTIPVIVLEGSSDSSNGQDGTWETAVFPSGNPGGNAAGDSDYWRTNIFPVSFSTSHKTIRLRGTFGRFDGTPSIQGIHLYGQKAAGQTLDDVIFCNSEGVEKTALLDWGDEPEGSTDFETIYLKNVSTKTANGVNIQLNHADFLMSWDQINWTAVLDITSLNTGQISAPIYIKLALGPPLLMLGPRAARAIVTVTSWTA